MRKLALFAILLFLSSCSIYDNFTTYFNTFYNADRDFEEVLELIENQEEFDQFNFKLPPLPSKSKNLIESIIVNLSFILQHHPNSAYVDESLLMLGKIFYLDQKFPKAERKFEELATKNNPELLIENLIWLGKAQLQQRKFETGIKTLSLAKKKAKEEDNIELFEQASVAEISFLLFRKENEQATIYSRELFNFTENEELKSRLAFEIGQIFYKENNFEEATNWFDEVLNHEPTFNVEFRSRMQSAIIKRELKDYETSIEKLEYIESEDKFDLFKDEIQIELGITYFEVGDINNAVYNFVRVDSLFKAKPSAAQAKFMLAKIMDKIYKDYDSAYVLYNEVSKSKADEKIKNENQIRLATIQSYLDESKKQREYTKQYLYFTDKDYFKKDSLAYEDFLFAKRMSNQKDSIKLAEAGDDLANRNPQGNLNNQNPTKRQIDANKTINERLAEDREKQIKASKEPQKPVRPKIQVDSLKNMLSEVLLNKGNLFFSELDVPDSAAFYYNRIINEFDSSEYLPNAFYNLGSYYLSIANKTRGDSLFNYVYNTFPDHPFAEAAAIKLGFLIEEKKDDPSENDFEFIDNLISEHKFDSVLIKSDEIINKYPKTQAAAKSIFIKGWIFENKLEKPDSAISNYRKLIAEFRTTEFTRTITPKVREWDKDVKEKERRLKAVQDSVANAALPDSLKNQNKNLKAPNTKKEQNVEKISEPKENPNSQQIPFPEPPNAQKPDSTKIISDNKVNRIEMFKTKNVNTVLDSLKNTPIPTDSTKGK